jgi:hypothetical protein
MMVISKAGKTLRVIMGIISKQGCAFAFYPMLVMVVIAGSDALRLFWKML